MVKIKRRRTADCVVGGFRYASKLKVVGSLLLGLYDDSGVLHHVGFTSSIKSADKQAVTRTVEVLRAAGASRAAHLVGPAGGGPGAVGRMGACQAGARHRSGI